MKKRVLTIPEVAEALNASKSTVYRLIGDGDLPALKVRETLRVPVDGFEEYLRRQRAAFQEENVI